MYARAGLGRRWRGALGLDELGELDDARHPGGVDVVDARPDAAGEVRRGDVGEDLAVHGEGLLRVEAEGRTLWNRKSDGGFPEITELKRRVRDVVAPAQRRVVIQGD